MYFLASPLRDTTVTLIWLYFLRSYFTRKSWMISLSCSRFLTLLNCFTLSCKRRKGERKVYIYIYIYIYCISYFLLTSLCFFSLEMNVLIRNECSSVTLISALLKPFRSPYSEKVFKRYFLYVVLFIQSPNRFNQLSCHFVGRNQNRYPKT